VPAFIANPQDLALKLSVNGEGSRTRAPRMIFDIREQLVTLSAIMTLDPGDVVLTGTPAGVRFPKRLSQGRRPRGRRNRIDRQTIRGNREPA
jgi:2-keto-4-pentenoate hydratase/2-oxohepta-3-ene-1,7-dioic acid hydratase in catechol pathway